MVQTVSLLRLSAPTQAGTHAAAPGSVRCCSRNASLAAAAASVAPAAAAAPTAAASQVRGQTEGGADQTSTGTGTATRAPCFLSLRHASHSAFSTALTETPSSVANRTIACERCRSVGSAIPAWTKYLHAHNRLRSQKASQREEHGQEGKHTCSGRRHAACRHPRWHSRPRRRCGSARRARRVSR